MKFYSDKPNLHIIRQKLVGNRAQPYELCVFDENGELETEDSEVIRELQNIYRHEESKKYECKKCGFTTANKGELAAHYKNEHPQKPTCKKCVATFETKKELTAHTKKEHPNK